MNNARTDKILTLTEHLAPAPVGSAPSTDDDSSLIGLDAHWQLPAATEKAAYDAMRTAPPRSYEYCGFAWATVIDGIRGDASEATEILKSVSRIHPLSNERRRATVAQHIHAIDFASLLVACGITDLFWSHADDGTQEVPGLVIHPFPLYPAQAPQLSEPVRSDRRTHLANFIGAYNPKNYLSDVRKRIFDLEGTDSDLLITRRDAWHFDRAVYKEQVSGIDASADERLVEARRKAEYLEAMRSSWFTLCPTGSGPNSIRLFESLAVGSIPILLSDTLRLPGDAIEWAQAAIIVEDSHNGLRQALERARDTSETERISMVEAGQRLFGRVGPAGYRAIVEETMSREGATA